jgi:hypothetical protein
MSKCLYLIGSLRNERIPELAKKIRKDNPDSKSLMTGIQCRSKADDCWKLTKSQKDSRIEKLLKDMQPETSLALIRDISIDRPTSSRPTGG